MNIRENLDVVIEKYPYYESLNKKLLEVTDNCVFNDRNKNHELGTKTNVFGQRTGGMKGVFENNKECNLIIDWIFRILFNKYDLKLGESGVVREVYYWFAKYNEGDYAIPHHHVPFALYSWVYFIKCPKGSSPLVFTTSGKRVKAEEGKVVIFPSPAVHHVPKNKCKDRIVMAGNIEFNLNT